MPAQTNIHLFGPAHLAILASVPACAAALAWIGRRKPGIASYIRLTLAALLTLSGLWWYWYRFSVLHVEPPQGLPFELCDISLWLTIYSLVRVRQRSFELAYYWGLGGAAMAMLTPDLLAPLVSISSINFFARHGGLILALLYLLWSRQVRPRSRSWLFAFFSLNLYAIPVAFFDFLFGTNYLYLRNKPASLSLLDTMGKWPIYIFSADLLALILFLVMAVPFRNVSAEARRGWPRMGTPC
jgi:hypothetical integral membrane protein (TIGR02206 family)